MATTTEIAAPSAEQENRTAGAPAHLRRRVPVRPSLTAALWAVAVAVGATQASFSWTQSGLGYDFLPVYGSGRALAAGRPLYSVASFVYPPSAALLVGRPMNLFPYEAERHALIIGVLLVLYASAVLAARAMGRPWFGDAAAAGAIAAGICGWTRDLLTLENMSALVALGAAATALAWVRGREVLAGALLGLTLSLKPMLAILLLGLLVLRRWRALAAALAVPLVLNLLTLAFDASALDGVSKQIPDLLAGHGAVFDAHNGAIVALARTLGVPPSVGLAARIAVGAAAAAGAVLVWRRRPDPARSLEAAGILVGALFVVGSLYEDHFVFVLVPFAFAALEPRSPLRWWPVAGVAVLAFGVVQIPAGATSLSSLQMTTVQRGLGLTAVLLLVTVAALRAPPAAGAPAPSLLTGVAPRESDGWTRTVKSSSLWSRIGAARREAVRRPSDSRER